MYRSRSTPAVSSAPRGPSAQSPVHYDCNTCLPLLAGWQPRQAPGGGCPSDQLLLASLFSAALTASHTATPPKYDMTADRGLRERRAAFATDGGMTAAQ